MDCYMTGYHVHKEIWKAAASEVFIYIRKLSNMVDRYTVVVVNSETVTLHLPQRISKV